MKIIFANSFTLCYNTAHHVQHKISESCYFEMSVHRSPKYFKLKTIFSISRYI